MILPDTSFSVAADAGTAPATLLWGGTVIDGTGAPRVQADVLIVDGRIAAVGPELSVPGGREVQRIDCLQEQT